MIRKVNAASTWPTTPRESQSRSKPVNRPVLAVGVNVNDLTTIGSGDWQDRAVTPNRAVCAKLGPGSPDGPGGPGSPDGPGVPGAPVGPVGPGCPGAAEGSDPSAK